MAGLDGLNSDAQYLYPRLGEDGGEGGERGDIRLLMYLTLPPMRMTREFSGRACISLCRLDSYSRAEIPGVSSSLLTGRSGQNGLGEGDD